MILDRFLFFDELPSQLLEKGCIIMHEVSQLIVDFVEKILELKFCPVDAVDCQAGEFKAVVIF